MGNHLLHIWILSFQSPSQNASDANGVLDWFEFIKKSCYVRPWGGDFYEDGPKIQSTAELSDLLLSWFACLSPSDVLVTLTLNQTDESLRSLFSLDKTCEDYGRRGGAHPKHWSSVFSAVIREFKHSTSLSKMTQALTPFLTRHPPAPRRLILWRALPSLNSFHRLRVWTTTQRWNHLLHFYTLLCLLILYT